MSSCARAIAWADTFECGCVDGGPCRYTTDEGDCYVFDESGGADYERCPVALTHTAEAHEIARWYRWAQVAPLEKWPCAYPVWVVEGVTQLQERIRERQVAQLKKG